MPILGRRPVALPSGQPSAWTARGGATLMVRGAGPGDFAAQRAFIDRLSRESRYLRFLTGGLVRDDVIADFLRAPDALVASVDEEGGERIVGNGHYVIGADGGAEFAVVVEDGWQGKGLGRELIRRLIERARRAGVPRLHGEVLSENRRMLAILRGMGFATPRHPDDSMLHLASMRLDAPATVDADRDGSDQWMPRDWFAMR